MLVGIMPFASAGPAQPMQPLLFGIAAVSAGALGIALFGQYVAGLTPCQLCLYARIPYLITGTLAVAGLALRTAPRWQVGLAVLCALVFLGGAMLALYHVGVEQHWWAGPASCRGEVQGAAALGALVEGKNVPPLRPCDQDVWRLLGLSLAGWNGIASLLLAATTLGAAAKLWKDRSR